MPPRDLSRDFGLPIARPRRSPSMQRRTWYLIVRERLFSGCDLSKMVRRRKERLPFYYSFLVENPDKAACVRVLRVPHLGYLWNYLPLLLNVQKVTVDIWRWKAWEEETRDVQSSFPMVKSLSTSEKTICDADMVMIPSIFPRLSTFKLSYSPTPPLSVEHDESNEVETTDKLLR